MKILFQSTLPLDAADQAMADFFTNELGAAITLASSTSEIDDQHDIVFLSERPVSGDYGSKYAQSKIPVLHGEPFAWDDIGWCTGSTGGSGTTLQLVIEGPHKPGMWVLGDAHLATDTNLTVSTSSVQLYGATNMSAGITGIGLNPPGTAEIPVALLIEKGTVVNNGTVGFVTQSRMAGWGADNYATMTDGCKKLLRSMIRWLVGEDRKRTILVPIFPYDPTLTVDETAPAIVTGSVSFDITADKQPTIALTAEAAATFLINLSMAQTAATPTKEGSVTFAIDVDEAYTNTAAKPVSVSIAIDLNLLTTAQADLVKDIIFNIELDQAQTYFNIINEVITFDIDLSFELLNQLVGVANASLNIDVTMNLLNQMIGLTNISFDIDLALAQIANAIRSGNVSFDVNLALDTVNQLAATATADFDINLGFDLLNQLIGLADASLDINLALDTFNNLVARTDASLDIDLALNAINTLTATGEVSFDISLDFLGVADAPGEISAAITFLVNMAQSQTNTLTANRAFELIVNMAEEQNAQLDKPATLALLIDLAQQEAAYRGVPGEATFSIDLDETQSVLATRVAVMALNASLDQAIQTQLDYNLFVNLATTLSDQYSTDGEIVAAISFGVQADQQVVPVKSIADAISFAIDSNFETEINLTATGTVTFSAQMEQVLAKQLDGQNDITFGHLLGLASIDSADLGADITFSTIQDMQVNGFILQFELLTPDSRILRINIEDRTLTVDGSKRVIRVRR